MMISAQIRNRGIPPLIVFAVLILGGCHGSHQQASPQIVLPAVTARIVQPRLMDDGSVMILEKQYVQHIGTPGVFILDNNGKARFRMVRAGKTEGKWVEITSGLKGDEKVLEGSLESVFDGSPVTVNDERRGVTL